MEQHGYEKYKAVLASVGGYLPAARLLMQSDREALHRLERSNPNPNPNPTPNPNPNPNLNPNPNSNPNPNPNLEHRAEAVELLHDSSPHLRRGGHRAESLQGHALEVDAAVAVAHVIDDQLEGVLLDLVRGRG